jgi:hypothetical protein
MAQIFISYAREDVAVAKLVKTGLQARGFSVALDIDDFQRGIWADQISGMLKTAQDVLVLVGPASLASEQVGCEVSQATALGRSLVPVLLNEPPADRPAWADALLRNQAARYDALDFEVSLARIVRLLSCEPAVQASVVPTKDSESGKLHPPEPPSVNWGWVGLALVVIAAPVLVWISALWPPPIEPADTEPAPAASATSQVRAGKLQIVFKGQIRREQIESLEAQLRQAGFAVERSKRTGAASGNYVEHDGDTSADLANGVRARAQALLAELGCKLQAPLTLRALNRPVSGDLTVSLVGACP